MSVAGESEIFRVFLGLGSNIDPEEHLPKAVDLIGRRLGIERLSSIWETPPVGGSGPNFLNAVAMLFTRLPLEELRTRILRPVEAQLGRVRTADPNAPRTIDLDILIWEDQVIEPDIWEQAHWCVPLAELIPDYRRPDTGEPLHMIAQRLAKATPIHRRTDIDF